MFLTDLIDYNLPPTIQQLVIVQRVKTLPSGIRFCHKRKRWLHVSLINDNLTSKRKKKNFINIWFSFSFRMSRPRRFKFSVRTTTSTTDFSRKKRWRVYLWCTSENTPTSFPGIIHLTLTFFDFWTDWYFHKAHDHAIKCLAMDPHEEIFVTGSADGDIKVSVVNLRKTFKIFSFDVRA